MSLSMKRMLEELDKEMALAAVRAQAGQLSAFGRLVELSQAQVYGIALRVLLEPEAAQDIAQETYLKVYRKLGTLSNVERAGAWIRRIVTRLALNHKRALRLHFVPLPDDTFKPLSACRSAPP